MCVCVLGGGGGYGQLPRSLPSKCGFSSLASHRTIREEQGVDGGIASNQRTVKEMLTSVPTLAYFDAEKPATASADASSYGLGGVLLQEQPGGPCPVAPRPTMSCCGLCPVAPRPTVSCCGLCPVAPRPTVSCCGLCPVAPRPTVSCSTQADCVLLWTVSCCTQADCVLLHPGGLCPVAPRRTVSCCGLSFCTQADCALLHPSGLCPVAPRRNVSCSTQADCVLL